MRHRVRDHRTLTASALSTASLYYPSEFRQSTLNTNVYYKGLLKTMDDQLTPGWLTVEKFARPPLNPLVLSVVNRVAAGRQTAHFENHNGYWEISGDLAGWLEDMTVTTINNVDGLKPGLVLSDLDRMRAIALTKASAKVFTSAVMSGESLAGLVQTLGMLRRPFKSVTRFLHGINDRRKYLLKKGQRASKATADAWLESRYGWKPLLLDCDAAIEAVFTARERCLGANFLVSRASAPVASLDRKRSFDNSINWYMTSRQRWNARREESMRVTAGVLFERRARTTASMLQATLGLRPRDVMPTVWELVPFSFVVDWFVNVGEFVQAVTPDPDCVLIGNWITSVQKDSLFITDGLLYGFNWQYPAWQTNTVTPSTVSKTTVTRLVNQPLQTQPRWMGKPLSVQHAADGAALLLKPIHGLLNLLRH